VIAGQGTLVLETLEDQPELEDATWLVPVGGGGLIAGVGAALKERPAVAAGMIHLIGVQSEASPFMYELYHAGSQDHAIELPSLADGLAGPVEEGSITVPMVRRYVDDLILVSEAEIAQAVSFAWHKFHERIEGSAAVPLAAVLMGKITARPAVIVISGGNIQPEVHHEIVEGKMWKQ